MDVKNHVTIVEVNTTNHKCVLADALNNGNNYKPCEVLKFFKYWHRNERLALQSSHTRVKVCPITGGLTVYSMAWVKVSNHQRIDCLFNGLISLKYRKHHRSALLGHCEVNPSVMDSPHKGLVIWKMFPCQDIITRKRNANPYEYVFPISVPINQNISSCIYNLDQE